LPSKGLAVPVLMPRTGGAGSYRGKMRGVGR
jgi:hypothetical protein